MNTLIIRKKSLKTWLHIDSVLGQFIISKFYFNADGLNFQIVEQGQSKRVIYTVTDITLYDDTVSGSAETFASITALSLRLEQLNYPAFQYDGQIVSIANLIEAGTNVTITGSGTEADPYVINSSGGGGGGIESVTGDIVDNTDPLNPIIETPTLQQVTEAGNEIVSDDELFNIIINRNSGAIQIYKRDDVGDAFVLVASYANNGLQITSLDGTQYANVESERFAVTNPTTSLETQYAYNKITNALDDFNNPEFLLPTFAGGGKFAIEPVLIYADFTAENSMPYVVTANATATDPASGFYTVFVQGGTATIGGIGYTAGALVYRYYDGSVWVSKDYGASITIDSTPTDGSANAVSSNGVFDALDAKVNHNRYAFQGKTSITGVTGEQDICSFKISGGAYSNTSDAFKLDFTPIKSVTASTSTFKVYIGTTANARTNQIMQTAIGTTGRSSDNTRRYGIDSSTIDTSVNFTANANSGLSASTTANTPIAVNMANDLWITITANPTASGESHGVMMASITPLK